MRHLGDGRRAWAATIAAGPAAAKAVPEGAPAAPREREALLAWSAASTRELLDALREAGPDRACWTWWPGSQSPQTSGAAARHHLTDGRSWRVRLSADGARTARLPVPAAGTPDVSASATANDLVLAFYGRLPIDALRIDGNVRVLEQLRDWDA